MTDPVELLSGHTGLVIWTALDTGRTTIRVCGAIEAFGLAPGTVDGVAIRVAAPPGSAASLPMYRFTGPEDRVGPGFKLYGIGPYGAVYAGRIHQGVPGATEVWGDVYAVPIGDAADVINKAVCRGFAFDVCPAALTGAHLRAWNPVIHSALRPLSVRLLRAAVSGNRTKTTPRASDE